MVKAAEVFSKGFVICIGNGEKTDFWNDPWLLWHGRPTSIRVLTGRGTVEPLKVWEVIDQISCQWEVQQLKELVPEPVLTSILQVPLRHQTIDDSFKWNGSTNGVFSVKSAYALAMKEDSSSSSSHETELCFKKLWSLRIPASLQLFTWKALNKALPVGDVLSKHHVIGDLRCVWCNGCQESHAHALFSFCDLV
ncbi:Ribonuclease h-like superfamily protein [Thalictrum thalictroides]|uniref:Ribonuclease h-like superfamily protein n=1 Tax=Thalictrum thalictroides TaxID=46969 RepID=A0A7J6VLT4_THATH|nr:Ribonuclease h-like superfamily protein [Thalictrum thalictroides]